jgi:hypothetical protein
MRVVLRDGPWIERRLTHGGRSWIEKTGGGDW